ncbi:MAG: hypothetical protein ABH950_08695 [Candidatus Altiarchaeota archaeon]
MGNVSYIDDSVPLNPAVTMTNLATGDGFADCPNCYYQNGTYYMHYGGFSQCPLLKDTIEITVTESKNGSNYRANTSFITEDTNWTSFFLEPIIMEEFISCDDGLKNGNESGIDCGGDCAPTCLAGSLSASAVTVENGTSTNITLFATAYTSNSFLTTASGSCENNNITLIFTPTTPQIAGSGGNAATWTITVTNHNNTQSTIICVINVTNSTNVFDSDTLTVRPSLSRRRSRREMELSLERVDPSDGNTSKLCMDEQIRITVRATDGDPIRNVDVDIYFPINNGAKIADLETNTSGVALFTPINQGGHLVEVDRTGYRHYEREFTVEICEDYETRGQISVSGKCVGQGVVIGISDVTIYEESDTGRIIQVTYPGGYVINNTTNAGGIIQFNPNETGEYSINLSIGGENPNKTFTISNCRRRNISGTFIEISRDTYFIGDEILFVVLNERGQTLRNQLVRIYLDGELLFRDKTGRGGVFTFTPEQPGEYTIKISGSNEEQTVHVIENVTSEQTTSTLTSSTSTSSILSTTTTLSISSTTTTLQIPTSFPTTTSTKIQSESKEHQSEDVFWKEWMLFFSIIVLLAVKLLHTKEKRKRTK